MKKKFNYEYIAFLPIGISFIFFGMVIDQMAIYSPMGMIFVMLSVILGFNVPRRASKKEKSNEEAQHDKEAEQTENDKES